MLKLKPAMKLISEFPVLNIFSVSCQASLGRLEGFQSFALPQNALYQNEYR
jgi:hypothetical protein